MDYRVVKNRPRDHFRRYWCEVQATALELPAFVEHHQPCGFVSVGSRFVAADHLMLVPLLVLLNTVLFWNV
jgi:hypothetical protein